MIPKKVIPRSISSGLGLLWSGRLSCGAGQRLGVAFCLALEQAIV